MVNRKSSDRIRDMSLSQKILLSIPCLLLPCSLIFAHGSGVSYEVTKDGYKIDIGYEEFIAENESVRFDFALYPEVIENREGEVFSDVWVTITKDKKIYFAGAIDKPRFGTTGFTYVFPEQGTFTISSRFEQEGETLTKDSFDVIVIQPLDYKEPLPPYVIPIAFFGLGLFVSILSIVLWRFLTKK